MIIQRIVALLSEKKLKKADLCKYLGVNTSTMANWQTRNTDPPSKYIIPICEFLEISPYYLLTGSEPDIITSTISTSDQELLDLIHQRPEDVQREYKAEIKGYVKALNKESGEMPGKSLA